MSHWSRRWLCSVANLYEMNSRENVAQTLDPSRPLRAEPNERRVLSFDPNAKCRWRRHDGSCRRRLVAPTWLPTHHSPLRTVLAFTATFGSCICDAAAFPRSTDWPCVHDCESHAIGAWLPELEFTHYAATKHWKSLIESCSAHLSVSGNILAATPYYQTETPFLAWVAAGWHDDRKDRVYPLVRKLVDRADHHTKREAA